MPSDFPVLRGAGTAQVAFSIGGVEIVLEAEGTGTVIEVDGRIRAFSLTFPSGSETVRLLVRRDRLERSPRKSVVYENGTTWTLSRDGGGWQFDFFTPRYGSTPYRSMRLDESFSAGEIVLNPDSSPPGPEVRPLGFPLTELLVVQRLARAKGVLFHACGVRDEKGRGILFAGRSGDGKTTTAHLWAAREGITVLSDERIVLRRSDQGFRVWGTPWHGDGGYVDDSDAPLAAVFLIEHGARTQAMPLSEFEAIATLFPRCFPPYYDSSGTERVLGTLSLLARSVPCFRLPFVPDASAVEYVRRVVESLPG